MIPKQNNCYLLTKFIYYSFGQLFNSFLFLGSAAEALLEESRGSDNFQEQVSALTSGPSLALGNEQ